MDDAAIRTFLASEYPRLVAAVALISGSRASGEDAVQEALVRAWERAERGEEIDSVTAWVMTVALNLARSSLRRLRAERRAQRHLRDDARLDANVRPRVEESLDLERGLAALPRRQREVTVLHYYLGLEVLEVADVLAVKEGTVKSCLHRARKSLASALSAPEGEVAEHAER